MNATSQALVSSQQLRKTHLTQPEIRNTLVFKNLLRRNGIKEFFAELDGNPIPDKKFGALAERFKSDLNSRAEIISSMDTYLKQVNAKPINDYQANKSLSIACGFLIFAIGEGSPGAESVMLTALAKSPVFYVIETAVKNLASVSFAARLYDSIEKRPTRMVFAEEQAVYESLCFLKKFLLEKFEPASEARNVSVLSQLAFSDCWLSHEARATLAEIISGQDSVVSGPARNQLVRELAQEALNANPNVKCFGSDVLIACEFARVLLEKGDMNHSLAMRFLDDYERLMDYVVGNGNTDAQKLLVSQVRAALDKIMWCTTDQGQLSI